MNARPTQVAPLPTRRAFDRQALDSDVEAIADAIAPRVAALLQDTEGALFPRRGLVAADRVAALLDVDRSWVYENKAELGAVRIGSGRGTLRFEAEKVLGYLRDRRLGQTPEPPARRPGPRRGSRTQRQIDGQIELLPLPDGLA